MSTHKRQIVILGAAGRIGDAAARAFVSAGWQVKGVGRNARIHEMAPGVEPIVADARDRSSLVEACQGADVVLNALNPEYDEWDTKVLPMAQNVIAAVKAVGATQLLPGNVYNFGHDVGMNVAEDARQVASTGKAKIGLQWKRCSKRRRRQTACKPSFSVPAISMVVQSLVAGWT